MNIIVSTLGSVLLLWSFRPLHADELVDYNKLEQSLKVGHFRAGNHDPEGNNEYYFVAEAFALLISKREAELGFEKRKKISQKIGEIGDFKIKSLSFWPSETEPVADLNFSGDDIRSMVSRAMAEFKAKESGIAIFVRIQLFEREKKYGFLGADTFVAEASYYPLSETINRSLETVNRTLQITDDKGTYVSILVNYKVNEKKKAGN